MAFTARLENHHGAPISVRDVIVTPECQMLVARAPFAAFAWNRPTMVVVEHDGRVRRIRVLDVTRLAQLALFAAAALCGFACARRQR